MLNRMGFVLLLYCGLLLVAVKGLSQPFTFAETHPVNNPDSLEAWLQAHPKAPAVTRLKNLIALERTHDWVRLGDMGRHLPEIYQLATQTRNATALAAYEYIKAEKSYLLNDYQQATVHGFNALSRFEALNDVSGLINTHFSLCSVSGNRFGEVTTADSLLANVHWKQALALLAINPNPHDQLVADWMAFDKAYNRSDAPTMRQCLAKALRQIAAYPSCLYAKRVFERSSAILYFLEKDYLKSYNTDIRLLNASQKADTYELASLYHNLGDDCLALNRPQEGLTYYDKAAQYAKGCLPVRYPIIIKSYESAGELAAGIGLHEKAYTYLMQARRYEKQANSQENSRRMQELQARYESARRQRQIDLLQQKQEIAQLQSNTYMAALGLAVVALVAISLLARRLYQNRRKLQQTNRRLEAALTDVQQLNTTLGHFIGIIAHDMRKPLISFRSLAELVGDRLKKRAYGDIQLISRAIDQAGSQIETMLDNLLRWALAQRETIPYKPENIPLLSLLHRVTDLYQNLVQFQNIQITVACPDTLHVWADDNGLQLIVRNLLDNALKHLGAVGEVRITATVTADRQALIQIKDSGEGIASNRLAFLLSFFAGDIEGHVGQKGLGLGLLLVRDFAARNQGHVEVVSQPGHNTCFSVYMPLSINEPTIAQNKEVLNLQQ
ncbi:ATP-binding protein [Fibrella aquatica]|uniref:ATP-binding protein n=1 Tax=Fibrella aquatica TaxID=3242487 RepID=UPI0035205216